jgi:hypothetical protein
MSNDIPILIPSDICTNNDDNLTCLENISKKDCNSIKTSINNLITSKNTQDLNTYKDNLKTTDIKKFLKTTSDKINNVFSNFSCIIENINNNSTLNLTDDEKIEPADETKLKYNFIADIIENNKELKTKLFDNLGGNKLKVINIISIIFFAGSIILIIYLMLKK